MKNSESRNFKIVNLVCDSTYEGTFFIHNLHKTNESIINLLPLSLKKHYGNVDYYIQEVDLSSPLKNYVYFAWLDGSIETEDGNRYFNEHGEKYDSHELFLIGFTDSPETCIQDIYFLGDKVFNDKAKGYFDIP